MSIDYGELERQFLATLKTDSGRTLDEWMAAIAAERLSHRNDIIDWLRRQGFMFSKASWLERIHNNGGKPIYAGAASARAQTRPRRATPLPRAAPPPAAVPDPAPPPPQSVPSKPALLADAETDPAATEALLARAKAYRPLAAYVIAEIRKAVPGAAVLPRDSYLVFRLGQVDFALLAISAKELRLALAVETPPAGAPLEPAKLPALRGAPAMNHMAVLTDARQVTPTLMAAIARAAAGT